MFRLKFLPALADVLEITVTDPDGEEIVSDGDELEEGMWRCMTETLAKEGNHVISVKANAKVVTATVPCKSGDKRNAALCRAEGAGLEDGKVAAFAKAPFRFLFPESMSEDSIVIEATGPDGQVVEMDGESMPGEKGCWICYYSPVVPGPHLINIACGAHPIPGFPKTVQISHAEKTFLGSIQVVNLPPVLETWDKRCNFRVEFPPAIPTDLIKVQVTYPSGTTVNCSVDADDVHARSFGCGMVRF